jgi:2-oxoglutarate dehydrogenase E2 component (dihydrolipoamide succinyltransferase)
MADVTMPQLGESVETGTIVHWLKRAGDAIRVDEPLFEVTSDKVTMEVPSLVAGTLGEIVVAEGEEVPVGTVLARIVGPGDGGTREPVTTRSSSRGPALLSPVVRRLAREHGIDVSSMRGSAENGRVTKRDLLAYLGARNVTVNGGTRAARTEPLSPQRRTLIRRLSAAQKSAVNVYSVIELDMEAVARERERRGLTYLPFVAFALIDALRAYPALNASLDEAAERISYHDAVHLGVAVDLDERGLVVPVVRDAQRLTLTALAREIDRVAAAARAGSLGPDDLSGSTFSITNNGSFGTLFTAPVINAPNVAIVSTDVVEERPVAIEHMIAIRRRMYLGMTWDHRAFDGSTAGRFLQRVKCNVESWDWAAQPS